MLMASRWVRSKGRRVCVVVRFWSWMCCLVSTTRDIGMFGQRLNSPRPLRINLRMGRSSGRASLKLDWHYRGPESGAHDFRKNARPAQSRQGWSAVELLETGPNLGPLARTTKGRLC
ncbi:hypothetical protein Micbo1qcDRAFT_53055 [Microdochium bolleyi]|uniref:Uncharacterized protein n=1 Tax=Microdochium bolleyi TaxID=196109 RepID=A0A136J7G1_9PEZI|nr:hypothetical protein Micbo1qcDRAFT_53055 [Microdochium bolleyi]